MPTLNGLAKFLEKFGDFHFDLEEFIIASQYADCLNEIYEKSSTFSTAPVESSEIFRYIIANSATSGITAYRNYRQYDVFEQIPFIDKDNLRKDPTHFLSAVQDPDRVWCKYTSGTTGTPVPIFYSAQFYFDQLYLTVRRIVRRAGLFNVPQEGVFCVALTDNPNCKNLVAYDPTGATGLTLQLVIDERSPEQTLEVIKRLVSLRPFCITGKPCLFEALLRLESCCPIPDSVALVISSGADLPDCMRMPIEALFGAPLFNAYGMTEFGVIASECRERKGLHIEPDCHPEIVDSSGQPILTETIGELVLTRMINSAMPLLRYKTGDLAILDTEPCGCGIIGPRLKSMAGRRVMCFRLPSGDLVSPIHFNELLTRFPIREFQITQDSFDSFRVKFESLDNCTNLDKIVEGVTLFVKRVLSEPVTVSVKNTKFSKNGKFERYRCELSD
jgi:phenylacetate-CoA ligase